MSYFHCPNCHHDTHIFGTGGVSATAKKLNVNVLASVPLHADICTTSDSGRPITISDPKSIHAGVYSDFAKRVSHLLIPGSHV